MSSGYIDLPVEGGAGGITSINADTTAAQVIAAGTGISVVTAAGTTTITNTGAGSGTVTSIDVSGGSTGLTTSGGPVTTSGVITIAGTLAVGSGGTNSTTALNNNRVMKSSGGAIVEAAAITASRALASDANGIPVAATTTTTELNFVSGVTSSIQTQLNAKQSTTLTSAHLLVGNGSNVATDVAASGDLTLANTGVFTFNTVNGNVGSFGTVSSVGSFTVNAKGLVTAASNTAIQITESQVTNLVSDLAAKQSTTLTNAHILVGNGSNVATDVAMSGDVNIANTGATSLVATSNATITTLSALTTASSLATVGTITSGTWSATTIAINKGGTGQTTANAAFNALSPLTTKGDLIGFSTVNARLPVGSDGQVLTADSTQTLGIKWATVSGSGTVTSVAVSGGTTGLTTSGGPITTSGTITLAGTLAVANGGTGTGTAFTQGSVVFAGASGVYAQDNSNFFWDATNHRLGIGNATPGCLIDSSAGVFRIQGGASGTFPGPASGQGFEIGYVTNGKAGNVAGGSGVSLFQSYDRGANQWRDVWFRGNNIQFDANGSPAMYLSSGGAFGIGTVSPAATLEVDTLGSSTKGIIVKGSSSQTANLQEWQNSSGAIKVAVTALGSTVLSDAALSTSATDGFAYIPTCAGTPTGTPTTQTGTVATVYDTTNNKLYVYNGAWKSILLL